MGDGGDSGFLVKVVTSVWFLLNDLVSISSDPILLRVVLAHDVQIPKHVALILALLFVIPGRVGIMHVDLLIGHHFSLVLLGLHYYLFDKASFGFLYLVHLVNVSAQVR